VTRSLLLEPSHVRRRPPRRRRLGHGIALLVGTIVLAAVALLAFMAARAAGPTKIRVRAIRHHRDAPAHSSYATQLAPAPEQVRIAVHLPLRSGLVFDVSTGKVLWARDPGQAVPIASLTKMMTALVIVAHAPPDAPVLITPDALHYSGSGVGLLPLGKDVPLETLLYGLLLPSGNDAAIALADHVAGTQSKFVAMMNAQAKRMGLRCTHFDSVSGIVDQGNYSCASDLATLAHAILVQPRLATIVASRSAILPFPIKGGKLYLYNNNPLVLARYPGIDGVKTGYTQAAGQCLVATARRGTRWLGVVLLHSANAAVQAQGLLNAGFATQT
jgi:D-alanyl-D-alanine carboxypeptidase (penicillin-binding protein 5/6)